MAKEQINKRILVNRLKRIEGQTRGLQKMIENDRDCESILMQLAAVRSAVESLGALVLNNYLYFCFAKENDDKGPEDIGSLARALAIWGRAYLKK